MATNLKIEDSLIQEAVELSGSRTKREAVTMALKEFIRHRRQLKLLDYRGQFDFDPDYDYKAERRRP